jgi:hypothetical protein
MTQFKGAYIVRYDDFSMWLKQIHKTKNGSPLTAAAQRDAISRCRRIKRYEGDLDEHFKKDKMTNLLNRINNHSITIDGNVKNGTASLLDLFQQKHR